MFTPETRLVTDKGLVDLATIAKTPREYSLLDGYSGRLVPIPEVSAGESDLVRVTLTNLVGTRHLKPQFTVDRGCRWVARTTHEDAPKDGIAYRDTIANNKYDIGYNASGWASGFVWYHGVNTISAVVFNEKNKIYKDKLFRIRDSGISIFPWLPGPESTQDFKSSFVHGWVNACGRNEISTLCKGAAEFFERNAVSAGYIPTGPIREYKTRDKFKGAKEYAVSFSKGTTFQGFRAVEVEPKGRGEVVKLGGFKAPVYPVLWNGSLFSALSALMALTVDAEVFWATIGGML